MGDDYEDLVATFGRPSSRGEIDGPYWLLRGFGPLRELRLVEQEEQDYWVGITIHFGGNKAGRARLDPLWK